MLYEISKCVICLHETPQHQRLPSSPTRILEWVFFFFFPYSLSSISALLKRQKRLMMEDTRWRDRCQQDGEKNPKTNTFSLDD